MFTETFQEWIRAAASMMLHSHLALAVLAHAVRDLEIIRFIISTLENIENFYRFSQLG